MKKRIVAFLMCAVMVLAGLPLTPLTGYAPFVLRAAAAETELGSVEIFDLDKNDDDDKNDYDGSYIAYEKRTLKLTAVVFDSEGAAVTDGIEYEWASSDKSIVTFDVDTLGSRQVTVIGLKKGQAEITVTASYGTGDEQQKLTATCDVSVKPLVSAIEFDGEYKLFTTDSDGEQLKYTVSPSDAGNKRLDWKTSPEGVVEVGSGFVKPLKTGICDVTATARDGSGISSSIKVIVTDGKSVVTLNKSELNLRAGEEAGQLKATCKTEDGSVEYDKAKWTSSNTSVAKVDENGTVTPVSRGKAIITAASLDGSGSTAECTVNVAQPVAGITVDSSALCYVGQTCSLTYKITPSNASDPAVIWSSADERIATVSTRGVVTGKKAGTVKITITSVDSGVSASCTVKVEVMPAGIELSESEIFLHVREDGKGETFPLSAEISPENATNKGVTWTSSNKKVATVDENGVVKAVAGGTATITAITKAGGKKDSCTVRVTQDESSVKISEAPENFYVGRTHTLTATVSPSTATNKKVSWKSSNKDVVSVSSSGVIEAKKAGTATITVTTENIEKTAKLKITVLPKINVSKITLNKKSAKIDRTSGKKLYLFVETVQPENASNKDVKWSSSNTDIATVNSSGVVTPKQAGEVRIKATAKDGSGVSAYCTVSVIEPVTGISLNKTKTVIEVDETVKLKATVNPSDATDKTVKWTSSKSSVASVSSSGLVTAKRGGTAIITAKTADGGYDVSCTVTVISPVKGIKINSGNLNVPLGEKRTLTATLSPSGATNQNIIWKSSNESVASVSASGTIKGKETGTAEISATSQDGGYKAVIEVNVIRPATSVALTFSSITLNAGKKKTLEATVKPLTATYKTVKWKSSNTKVAKVSSKGVVTAVSAGTATITCTSTDGYVSTKCKVTVTQPTTGIKAKSKKVTVKLGTPKTLKVSVLPENATNKNVVWTSGDTKIATVSSEGVVKGVKKGKVKITARTADGLYATVITVTVEKPVKSVSLNKTSLVINVGKTSVLKASVKPSSASDKKVTWSSSDNDIVKVSSDGKITAVAAGFAVVTCTTKDGKKKAECSVLVKLPVKSVRLKPAEATLNMGDTLKLKASVKPKNASNAALEWSSSDNKIAKVSSKGVVEPLKPGKVTITVTTKDGGYKDTCTVTVVRKVKSISVPEEKSVFLGGTEKIKVKITPSKATNKKLKWKSSDESVATVSSKGVVTPKKKGVTTITVKSVDGGYKDTCKVTVKTALESVKLDKTKLTLNAGTAYALKITKKPKKSTETIIWTTSKRSVATVSQKGIITAVARGTATITGITEHGDKVTCKVTVNQPVTDMKISKTKATVYMGDTLTLSANVLPKNANDQSFKWSTADKSVATVKDGKVTPKKPGTVKITAKSTNGKKAVCTVTVKRHVSSVSLNKKSVTVARGATFSLVPSVKPSDASDKTCTYKSSNTAVATVSDKGVITAKAAGEATVTVTTKDGKKTAACKVTVVEKVTGVTLSSTSQNLYIGDTFTLKATVSPKKATDKSVVWSTGNSDVATVKDGVVTAVGEGKTTITVKTVDGSFKARCTVKCMKKPVELKVNSVAIGNGVIYVEVSPEGWSSGFVAESKAVSVKVNGEAAGNAVCEIPSDKTGGVYEMKISLASFDIPQGATVSFTLPEGLITTEDGTQTNKKYTSSFVAE